ncbi:MAG: response regulator transcription factor [Bacteroidota bacterium]
MNPIKILLVDDHKLIRDAVRTYLIEAPQYVIAGEAEHGEAALEWLKANSVDIVLMDVNMQGGGGIQATRALRQLYPDTEVIALTMLNEPQYIREMFEAGAKGYLLKSCTEADIKEAIETVLRGQLYYSPEVSDTLIRGLSSPATTPQYALDAVTDREKEVLALIAQEYSNKEIAEALFISVRTVDAHRRNLLEKTGAKNTAGLTLVAIRMGLINPA